MKKVDWLTVAQFVLSLLAILAAWGIAAGAALLSLLGTATEAAFPTASLAVSAIAVSLLLLPSTILAFLRMIGRPIQRVPALPRWWPLVLVAALILTLLVGVWAVGSGLEWLILPVLHVLAVGLPIVLLVYLGTRRLPPASPQRQWGVFNSGLVLGPLLIMIAEIGALVLFGLLGAIFLSTRPDLLDSLLELAGEITRPGVTTDEIAKMIGPFLTQPAVIAAAFVFVAVVVPLIEEAIKPIGVWLLFGRLRRPAAGFAAGLLSGAGYAMFESLAAFSSGEQWASVTIARMGTAAVHVVTTGLTGWALVGAWREKRYLQLGLTYLAVIALHGVWNGMTVTLLVSELAASQSNSQEMPVMNALATAAPFILGLLTILCISLILIWNRKLRRPQAATADPSIQADTTDSEVIGNVL